MSGYWASVLTPVVIDAIAVLGLYIIVNCGRLSIGQAAFFGIGGYASAISSVWMNLPPFVSVLFGGVVAAFAGALFALVARKLSHWFFAIATLAFSIMVIGLVSSSQALGGATGFYGIPLVVGLPQAVVWLMAAIAVVIWLDSTTLGRAMRAIRDSEVAAESLAINAALVKVVSFAIGTAFAGVAGGLWAHYLGLVRPHDMGLEQSLMFLIYLAVGGIEFWAGALFGTFFLGLLPEILRFSREYRLALFGGLLAFVMILRPAGILPSLRELRGLAAWCLGRIQQRRAKRIDGDG